MIEKHKEKILVSSFQKLCSKNINDMGQARGDDLIRDSVYSVNGFRSVTGICNNLENPHWGSALTTHQRSAITSSLPL
jgi:hypothetical protein